MDKSKLLYQDMNRLRFFSLNYYGNSKTQIPLDIIYIKKQFSKYRNVKVYTSE